MHQHDYCQIEICREGRRLCRGRGCADVIIDPGDAVFIPAGAMHSFMPYKNKYSTYFSCKFRIANTLELPESISLIRGDFFMQWVLKSLEQLMPTENQNSAPGTALISEEMSVLITGVLNHLVRLQKDDFSANDMLQFMRRTIYQFGAESSVKFLADGLNLTVPQFRYRYRKTIKTLPQGTVTFFNPADFIAEELVRIIKKHLQVTTFSIGEISQMMKFNNVYTFSRFFKQRTGYSPAEYRKKSAGKSGVIKP